MLPERRTTLSLKDLSQAAENAVKLVSGRHRIKVDEGFIIDPGILCGRQVQIADLKQAEQIATEITQQVAEGMGLGPAGASAAAGRGESQVEPAVLLQRGLVLCGFFSQSFNNNSGSTAFEPLTRTGSRAS
jgi:hypothetical protein